MVPKQGTELLSNWQANLPHCPEDAERKGEKTDYGKTQAASRCGQCTVRDPPWKKIYFIKCPDLLAYLCSAICHWELLDMGEGNFSAFIIGNVGIV